MFSFFFQYLHLESSRPKGRGEKDLFDMVDEGGKDDEEEEKE